MSDPCQLGTKRSDMRARLHKLVLFAMLSSVQASAQSITGAILGTVFDSSGSVVPKAKVVVTNTGQGWTREAESDDLGNYIFNQLPPGPYKVGVSATGFQTVAVAP